MKKFFHLIIVLLPLGLAAQPVIDNTWQPPVGDSYYYTSVSAPFDFPAGGANQTWDYSNINLGPFSIIEFVDPSTTPNAADFPNSNLVIKDVSTSVYFYFEKSQTQLLEWGMSYAQSDVIYSDPLIFMPFPITYGDNVTDAATGSLYSGGGTRSKNRTIEGYGYGDLILPGVTLNNILCVKTLQSTIDDYGGGTIDTTLLTSYLFLSPNETYTVFWLEELIHDNDTLRYGYVKSAHLGLNDELSTNDIKTTVYPNPVDQGEVFSVNVVLKATEKVDINIIDITGKVVKRLDSKNLGSGPNNLLIDSKNLEKGIYFVKVSDINGEHGSTVRVVVK